jgi:Ca2+-binding EF-hand superfamily protein
MGYELSDEELAYGFLIIDTNEDDLISWQEMYEFADSQQKIALKSRSDTTDLIFTYFDTNGDGYLSYTEWANLCWSSDPY